MPCVPLIGKSDIPCVPLIGNSDIPCTFNWQFRHPVCTVNWVCAHGGAHAGRVVLQHACIWAQTRTGRHRGKPIHQVHRLLARPIQYVYRYLARKKYGYAVNWHVNYVNWHVKYYAYTVNWHVKYVVDIPLIGTYRKNIEVYRGLARKIYIYR